LLSSPADQRPERPLTGGEPVVLRNMNACGLLAFTLPTVDLEFVTHFGARKIRHSATLGSVIIEPERGQVRMIWHTCLPVNPRETDYLDATVIAERGHRAA
jgi:hypothetical protein